MSINHTKSELQILPKKEVVNVYYNLLKETNQSALKSKINRLNKSVIINSYIKLRNDLILKG